MRTAPSLIPLTTLALVFATGAAFATQPGVERPLGTPQANGAMHLVRAIPEACAWLEGTFTGDAANPYKFTPVRSSPTCQPRARFVDAAKAQPSEAKGWKLSDVIRIPSKDCPALQAVVKVWHKSGGGQPMALDAQGRARIYLKDAKQVAQQAPPPAMFAAQVKVEGVACK